MAKIFLAPTVSHISGKVGEGVYMISAKGGMSYLRNYSYPTLTTHNHEKGAIMDHLSYLWNSEISSYYKTEMKAYAIEYHALANYGKPRSDRAYSAFAVFVKLLFAIQKAHSATIDLVIVTMAELNAITPSVTSIAEQTTNGLLPITPHSAEYIANWD